MSTPLVWTVLFTCVFTFLTASNGAAGEETAEGWVEKAAAAAERGDSAEAIRCASLAIEIDPRAASAFYLRGRERFRSAQLQEAIQDFDRYVELRPESAPRQWERGIACYYAGRYQAGAKQFEMYQNFDGHDVENSVWRFLCMVPLVGVERAQKEMLPIENDRRVPMMQVYELFRGKLTPEQVLAAAHAGDPTPEVLAGRLFYAHLYLGLWHDANREPERAKRYVDLAADEKLAKNPRINRYMWDVARIHQRLLRGELKRPDQ